MNSSEVFSLLKPICDEVMKSPSQKNLQSLQETFKRVAPGSLLQLQDYVLYPLELNLQRPSVSFEHRRYIIDCIKELIYYTEVNRIKKFLHLYSLIFIQLFDKDSLSMVANVSEELKLSVIQCATNIIQKCSNDIIGKIYNKTNIPRISQGIFICVHIMQKEKMRMLKIAAIEFLMAITQVDDEEKNIEIWKPAVADTIMFIVPGILSGLHKVVVGDEKQGHLVTKVALKAWSRILVLVLEDIVIEKSQTHIYFSAKVTDRVDGTKEKSKNILIKHENNEPSSLLNIIQSQERNAEWAEFVSDNVTKMCQSLKSLQQHDNWKVRLELAKACYSILDKCRQHLKEAFIVLVEILLKLADDDDDANHVASTSQAALESLTKKFKEQHGISFYEILEENFYRLVSKLPRIIHVESDGAKAAALSLLKQYLQLLGPERLPQVLLNPSHLQRTVQALLQVTELEASTLTLLGNCSLRDLELNQDAVFHTPWKQFKHFTDKNTSQKLEEVLQLLGKYGDIEILSNHLLELLESDIEHRNEIVFILNEIILGGVRSEEKIHLVKNMLDMYLSPELWYVPLSIDSSTTNHKDSPPKETIPINQIRRNLQLVCLLAEGVGNAASALGTHFSRFLMRCLYVIVERAGSPHEALSASGLKAAASVAKAVHQGADITSLLSANMDYFMVQVSLRLRNLRRDPGVLSVLSVAMRHSSRKMLPYLQNAVADVLLQCCDEFQMHHTSLFLHVFYTFFLCIKKWFPNKTSERTLRSEETVITTSFVINDFLEYLKNSQLCKEAQASSYDSNMESAEQELEETSAQEEETSEKPEVPSHVAMTVSVLQRCLHLLPKKDKQCRLQALETIAEGLEILAAHEDQLLPLVHQVWSPLLGRLQDSSDPLLLNRSFALLRTIARLARDFIRTRTLKQVWPALCSFLLDSADKSKGKTHGLAYQHTQLFKLQLHLLEGLGGLALHLQMQEKEIHQMLRAASPYLSSHQPQPLQDSCINLFQTVIIYNADAVWLEMKKIQPHTQQMSHHFKGNNEYTKNSESVLELIFAHERMEV